MNLNEVFSVLTQEGIGAHLEFDLNDTGFDFALGQFDTAFLGGELTATTVLEFRVDVEVIDGGLGLDSNLGNHVLQGAATEDHLADQLVPVLLYIGRQLGNDNVSVFGHDSFDF